MLPKCFSSYGKTRPTPWGRCCTHSHTSNNTNSSQEQDYPYITQRMAGHWESSSNWLHQYVLPQCCCVITDIYIAKRTGYVKFQMTKALIGDGSSGLPGWNLIFAHDAEMKSFPLTYAFGNWKSEDIAKLIRDLANNRLRLKCNKRKRVWQEIWTCYITEGIC